MSALRDELASVVGAEHVLVEGVREYLQDASVTRGMHGRADAVVLPGTVDEAARAVEHCYARGIPIVPRGGGTGFAGGAVPDGGVVVALERLNRVRSFDPLLWRIEVEAGVTTGALQALVRQSGLVFPPDPGAAEQSQVGGNIATNAGGPHAFKYGVTGAWVTGLEVVVAPGVVVRPGGPTRKDVTGYDVKSLIVGSEGTLGIVTAAWLRLLPAPEAVHVVVALYDDVSAGTAAIERVLGNGLVVSTLEYLDRGTLAAAGPAFPGGLPAGAGFMVISEVDGSADEAARLRAALADVLGEGALAVLAPDDPAAIWRWRGGVSFAVAAQRGGRMSEDIVVPLDRLGDAIVGATEIGERHRLEALSWGHAGDGNLHAGFLVSLEDDDERRRAQRACDELFDLAIALGGAISGEHGIGAVKRDALARLAPPELSSLYAAIKRSFDPKGLFNPGKVV